MAKSSSSQIRLCGIFKTPTPGMQKKMIYLKSKSPLTEAIQKELNILFGEKIKHHYQSAELLLSDYKS